MRSIAILTILLLVAGLSVGCATTHTAEMWDVTMKERVDNVKVVEGGHDKRGLILTIPNPMNPGESFVSVVLGWTRSWGSVAGIPVDADDSARFMRAGKMGAVADNIIGAEVSDILLIEVRDGSLDDGFADDEETAEPEPPDIK